MRDWFTVEAIDVETYAISEYGHWEETHCYLLLGREKALLIDTGLGVANIKAVVDRLTALPVSVATTHAHWDHIGGHRYFQDIAVHELERDWLAVQFPIPLAVVRKNLTRPLRFPAGLQSGYIRGLSRHAPKAAAGWRPVEPGRQGAPGHPHAWPLPRTLLLL